MALLERVSTLVRANLNDLIDKAEDPEKMLKQVILDMQNQLMQVKTQVAIAIADQHLLEKKQKDNVEKAHEWMKRAELAVEKKQDDLARAALERKTLAQNEMQGLDGQIQELEAQQDRLTSSEQKLRTKVEAFRTKKEVVKAQYSAAEAQVQISEAATGVGEEMADVGLAMQRAMDKTEQMKARASAVEELEAAGTFEDLTALEPGTNDDIDRQLKELTSTSQVDDELAKMKAELGSGSGGGESAGQIEAGS